MTDAPQGSPRPISTRQDALAVVNRLREAGHVAYFAGGCVRDELLGMRPKDYDVATDAPPHRVRHLGHARACLVNRAQARLTPVGEAWLVEKRSRLLKQRRRLESAAAER